MDVSTAVWLVTAVVLVGVLAVDVAVLGRRPHVPSTAECGLAVGAYAAMAVAFGVGVAVFAGGGYAEQFFAGWLTEYSLSVDNLFVFVVIMGSFGVPRAHQQRALLVGIVLALLMRALFIAAGAAAISAFSWVFYVFGAFLVYTAVQLLRHRSAQPGDGDGDNGAVRWARRRLPMTPGYEGSRLLVVRGGRRLATPMVLVIVGLGTADLMFALDSIPAIFGLTEEPYLVFTANVFALMGLRQLYFLLGGLLRRLVYLSVGLALILAFIGVKLILHALHENTLPFLAGGQPLHAAPQIPTLWSLAVIVGTLLATTAASLLRNGRGEEPPAATERPGPSGRSPSRTGPEPRRTGPADDGR